MKKEITEANRIEELKIQEQINKCIDNSESFCFDAGAGAGKTYALVKSIEHILQDQDKRRLLKDRSQKILCIYNIVFFWLFVNTKATISFRVSYKDIPFVIL